MAEVGGDSVAAGSLPTDSGAQNQAEQPAHDGKHDGAPESGAKAINGKPVTKAEYLGEPGDEDQEDGIHDERHQAEGQDVDREREKTQDAANRSVHQTEDDCDEQQGQKVAQTLLGFAGGHDNGNPGDEHGGEPKGNGVDDGGQEK